MTADLKSILIYWSALILTLLLVHLYTKENKLSKLSNFCWLAVICLPLSFVAGLRYNVGTDFAAYCGIFEQIRALSLVECFSQEIVEVLFALIIKMLSYVMASNALVFFTVEFLTLFIAIAAVSKYKKQMNLMLFVFLYYLVAYHASLNNVRQTLAISVIIWAVTLLLEKKYKSSILVCLIAALVHSSAIICMVFGVVPLMYQYVKKNTYSAKASSAAYYLIRFLFYASLIIVPLLIPVILNKILQLSIFDGYTNYVFSENLEIGLGNIAYFALLIVPFLVLCGRAVMADEKLFTLSHIILFYIPLSFVGYYAEAGHRLKQYPLIIFLFFFPLLYRKIKNKATNTILLFWYLGMFGGQYVLEILIRNYNETFPYLYWL